MYKSFTFVFFLVFTFCHGQIKFEKGSILTEDNDLLQVYIKNEDWKSNPTSIEYKTTLEADKETVGLSEIKEFEIFGISKYIKAKVEIDQSPIKINNLNYSKNPDFEQNTVLLKLLISGTASLYKYEIGDNIKYFFKTENSEITQLVFKKYLYENNRQIKENKQFQQQLYNALKCKDISRARIAKLDYREKDLSKIFENYNTCKNPDYQPKFKADKRKLFNLNITPGFAFANTKIFNAENSYENAKFENSTFFRIGLESEYILPFNKNKWSLFLEASYQKYSASGRYTNSLFNSNKNPLEINYSYLNFTAGLRHYFYINQNSKVFINAGFNAALCLDGRFENRELSNTSNLLAGTGFKFLDKYGVEIRYGFNRNTLSDYITRYSEYNTITFIFSYTIL